MANAHTNGRGDQLLLGDEHLEIALRICLSELFGKCGVADFAVHGDHGGPCAQRLESIAIGLPGSYFVSFLVCRQGYVRLPIFDRGHAGFGFLAVDPEVTDATELSNSALRHIGWQRLPVPVLLVLDLAEAFAFDGTGDDHGGLTSSLPGLFQCLVDLLQVMAVDDDSAATEGLHPIAIHVGLPLILRWTTLAEAVDIEDRGEVGQPVETRLIQPFPDRALGELTVARQGP